MLVAKGLPWTVTLPTLMLIAQSVFLLEHGHTQTQTNKPGANGRVSYDSLTHFRLYCRDREKK